MNFFCLTGEFSNLLGVSWLPQSGASQVHTCGLQWNKEADIKLYRYGFCLFFCCTMKIAQVVFLNLRFLK